VSDIIVTTAHQAVGAALLATAVALAVWLQRLAAPAARRPGAPTEGGLHG
jgi:hypothetical protein